MILRIDVYLSLFFLGFYNNVLRFIWVFGRGGINNRLFSDNVVKCMVKELNRL